MLVISLQKIQAKKKKQSRGRGHVATRKFSHQSIRHQELLDVVTKTFREFGGELVGGESMSWRHDHNPLGVTFTRCRFSFLKKVSVCDNYLFHPTYFFGLIAV